MSKLSRTAWCGFVTNVCAAAPVSSRLEMLDEVAERLYGYCFNDLSAARQARVRKVAGCDDVFADAQDEIRPIDELMLAA